MRLLTLHAPYAALLASPFKEYETRPRSTSYRGWVVITTSKREPREVRDRCAAEPFRARLSEIGYRDAAGIPRGHAIGVVRIVDCRPADELRAGVGDEERAFGDWASGRFVYQTDNAMRLPTPLPIRGALGLVTVTDPAVYEAARKLIGAARHPDPKGPMVIPPPIAARTADSASHRAMMVLHHLQLRPFG